VLQSYIVQHGIMVQTITSATVLLAYMRFTVMGLFYESEAGILEAVPAVQDAE